MLIYPSTPGACVESAKKMRDFPSCFGENAIQVADCSSSGGKSAQNMVSCVYQIWLSGRFCVITITWNKSILGQGFSIGIDDSASHCLCRVDIKPWTFSKRKGSKSLEVDGSKVDIFWDLSATKFGSGPEPLEGYYVAVVSDLQMVLLLGDLNNEAYLKTNASPPNSGAFFVARKEHIFGRKVYCTKAKFYDDGQVHDVAIECEKSGLDGPYLEVRIDRKRVMQVRRLIWKFRGNQTILVDGLPVEVFWDVHNWLFGVPVANAVFMFQTCLTTEELVPFSCSQVFRETQLQETGFSLVLYAWKNE